ncbi:MAG TPA: ferritin-like domain-containing protein [Caldilineaceae bacterium]|nr:ferritin-like domain-containing protein [Caldilineaceae bacterium]
MAHHTTNGHGHKTLTAWLQDAYAMEEALVPILENHAKDAKGIPQMQSRIQQHAEETRRHAEMVRGCLEQIGEKPSGAKNLLGNLFGGAQSIGVGMFKDELIKNALTDFASEHFEIASYKVLIAAAEQTGHPQIAMVCRQILQDEERMAQWLDQQMPVTVQSAIQRAMA